MNPMIVLTVKRDGGTQDVLGFYSPAELHMVMRDAEVFLESSMQSRRAIARIELYNPSGVSAAVKEQNL